MALSDILKVSFEYVPKAGHRQLPLLSKDYESNIRGLYIVGDLADAPVIKVSLNQGYEITQRIAKLPDAKSKQEGVYDVLIIGAGPAGIGAAIACIDSGLSYLILEKERPLNTIQNYPKHKHVFAEPKPIPNKPMIWFDDSIKEDLVARWERLIDEKGIQIRQPEEVTDVKKSGDTFSVTTPQGTYRGRRVILAIGRRGTVRRLGVAGEERVDYALGDPDKYKGRKVLVVGGGDSAVEAAVALSQVEGTDVTISYRQDGFFRVKEGNRAQITERIQQGKIRFLPQSEVVGLTETSATLKVKGKITSAGPYQTNPDGTLTLDNDDVFVLIGGEPPIPFLRKIGIKMEGTWDWKRAAWLLFTFCLVYFVYGIKKPFWPFDDRTITDALSYTGLLDNFRDWFPWAKVNLYNATIKQNLPGFSLAGFFTVKDVTLFGQVKTLGPSFWYTVLYTTIMYVFGIQAMRRWRSSHQRKRFISLLAFQTVMAFLIPEFFAPYFFSFIDKGIEAWKWYAVANPWPLAGTWAYSPDYDPDGIKSFLVITGIISFVVMPIAVIFHGKRFCTWLCGCGGLAETLGDRWRHLAPKSQESRNAEWQGTVILGLAFLVAIVILLDGFKFVQSGAFHDAALFSRNYYDFIVDFWLVAVIPVALYPFFGGKIWCRFWCPMAKYMQLLSKWFGRLQIKSNEKCIGCGQCTRYCQVGIDVQSFAQRKQAFSNAQTSCIQCGICIEVCPMDVLSFSSERGKKVVVLSEQAKKMVA